MSVNLQERGECRWRIIVSPLIFVVHRTGWWTLLSHPVPIPTSCLVLKVSVLHFPRTRSKSCGGRPTTSDSVLTGLLNGTGWWWWCDDDTPPCVPAAGQTERKDQIYWLQAIRILFHFWPLTGRHFIHEAPRILWTGLYVGRGEDWDVLQGEYDSDWTVNL